MYKSLIFTIAVLSTMVVARPLLAQLPPDGTVLVHIDSPASMFPSGNRRASVVQFRSGGAQPFFLYSDDVLSAGIVRSVVSVGTKRFPNPVVFILFEQGTLQIIQSSFPKKLLSSRKFRFIAEANVDEIIAIDDHNEVLIVDDRGNMMDLGATKVIDPQTFGETRAVAMLNRTDYVLATDTTLLWLHWNGTTSVLRGFMDMAAGHPILRQYQTQTQNVVTNGSSIWVQFEMANIVLPTMVRSEFVEFVINGGHVLRGPGEMWTIHPVSDPPREMLDVEAGVGHLLIRDGDAYRQWPKLAATPVDLDRSVFAATLPAGHRSGGANSGMPLGATLPSIDVFVDHPKTALHWTGRSPLTRSASMVQAAPSLPGTAPTVSNKKAIPSLETRGEFEAALRKELQAAPILAGIPESKWTLDSFVAVIGYTGNSALNYAVDDLRVEELNRLGLRRAGMRLAVSPGEERRVASISDFARALAEEWARRKAERAARCGGLLSK